MRFSSSEILPVARANGFSEQVVEKALHLLNLLNALNSHPSLKGKWAAWCLFRPRVEPVRG